MSAETHGQAAELRPLMTIPELAEICRVTESAVRQWVRLDRVPYLKAGGAVRFDPDEIHAWLRSREGAMARHPRGVKA